MRRYILIYRGLGPEIGEVADRIAASSDLEIVEHFDDNLVVQGEDRAIRQFVRSLRGWVATPVRRIRAPEAHVHAKGPVWRLG